MTYGASQFNFSLSRGLLWNIERANELHSYTLNHELSQGRDFTIWRYDITRYGYGTRPSFWWVHNRYVCGEGADRGEGGANGEEGEGPESSCLICLDPHGTCRRASEAEVCVCVCVCVLCVRERERERERES